MKLREGCNWLVDLFEYMMMHGLTTPKCDSFSTNAVDTPEDEVCNKWPTL